MASIESAPEGALATFEQLLDLQDAFEDAEVELIRHQVQLTKPLLEKRAKLLERIPGFWPLVFEQAPPDIDEFVQPTDSALLLGALQSISVSRFEIEEDDGGAAGGGDPRSIAITWRFAENDHFEDRVIEKKFWHRRAAGGWAGLVSEPVDIKWKPGKDLTHGLLSMVRQVWEEEQQQQAGDGTPRPAAAPAQKALKKKMDDAGGVGGLSFFAWFGYRGRRVTAEESRVQTEKEREKKRLRSEGKEVSQDEDDKEEGEDEDEDPLEVFPDGDELAVCIADDLWPDAVKYFLQAQEQDAESDADFESEGDEEIETADDQPPAKKQKK